MGKKVVMVVDDEEPIVRLVTDVLEPEDFTVISALSGEEALEKLKDVVPDLMLIDFFMPGLSGRELLEKIRADGRLKDVNVIFLTAASFTEEGKRGLDSLNVIDFVKKPFEYKDLIQRVKKVIG